MVVKSFTKRELEATAGKKPVEGGWLFRLFMAWFRRSGRRRLDRPRLGL